MSPTVLLINPPIYDFAAFDLFNKPLGLLYMVSHLQQGGYQVRLLDCLDRHLPALVSKHPPHKIRPNGTAKYYGQVVERPTCLAHVPRHYRRYGLPGDMLEELLLREYHQTKPVAVLVTSMMTYWYPGVADTIRRVRRILPGVPVALGGVYATLMPDHAQQRCSPDTIITGPGWPRCLEWLDSLTDTKRDYQTIKTSFGDWPGPAYDLYDQLDYLTVITSLGCPFHCDYCASGRLQPQLQQQSPQRFVSQLQNLLPLLNNNRPRYNIAFMDDALLVNADQHLIAILRQLTECNENGMLLGNGRPVSLRFHCPNGLHCRYITGEVAHWMHRARFRMIRLSYEASGQAAHWQQAGDNKVTDYHFRQVTGDWDCWRCRY